MKNYTIAVAGTGYVGLSIATLLSQHHKVYAVDIIPEKVELINSKKSPIQDEYIEKYLAEKELDLTATLDAKLAYSNADFVVIAAPTNYDSQKNFFDTSAVETVIKLVMMDNSFPGTDDFNCTFEPAYNIEQICETMKKATGLKYKIPLIPGGLLMTAATILGPIGGKKVGIHPARVKKLMVSTNICGKKLAGCGYQFHYSFEDTFKDWLNDCNGQGLF